MPLLCISLLALLLLPLSLSCDSGRPPSDFRINMGFVITDLDNTNEIISTMLQNTSCLALRHRLRNCTPDNTDVVNTLHILTCKMKKLSISHTDRLVRSVLNSLQCTCADEPAKGPERRRRRRTALRQRRNKPKNIKRETKKLCKAKAILSAMTICYQISNTMLTDS